MSTLLKRLASSTTLLKVYPDWVSDNNISGKAYEKINELKMARLLYISTHNNSSDYTVKKMWQISASQVARDIGAATTTLISTSAYSPQLKLFLDKTNHELFLEKEKKLQKHKKTLGAGTKQRKKDELVLQIQQLTEELESLKQKNALDQVREVVSNLSLPVKQKLGFNP